MSEIMAQLRWYPGDALIEFKEQDLKRLADKYGVAISLERVTRNALVIEGEKVVQEPRDLHIEEVAQTVVTVSSDRADNFRKCIRQLIDMYRSPVPAWGLWGSSREGEAIASQVIEEDDGW